jgi:hypothetical protein
MVGWWGEGWEMHGLDNRQIGVEESQEEQSDQKLVDDTLRHSDASSTSSLRWGSTKDSLGFEYWLEDDFFDIDVF